MPAAEALLCLLLTRSFSSFAKVFVGVCVCVCVCVCTSAFCMQRLIHQPDIMMEPKILT